jgi:hypothetical protein
MELIEYAAGFVLACNLRSCACEKVWCVFVRMHAIIQSHGRVCARVICMYTAMYFHVGRDTFHRSHHKPLHQVSAFLVNAFRLRDAEPRRGTTTVRGHVLWAALAAASLLLRKRSKRPAMQHASKQHRL